MKFTNSFWEVWEEFIPLYAVEYAGSRINDGELTVYATAVFDIVKNNIITFYLRMQ